MSAAAASTTPAPTPAIKKLLSDVIADANRATDAPSIPLDTQNWKLNQIISRANYAMNIRLAGFEAALAMQGLSDPVQDACANFFSEMKTLVAESSAAVAVMRSKSRTGYTARVTPVTRSSDVTPSDVVVQKLDEFGEPVTDPA